MPHLYLVESNAKVGLRENQIIVQNLEDDTRRSIPIAEVDGISVFGKPQISTQLIRECMSRNISVGYYANDGHYFGHIGSLRDIEPMRQKRQIYLTDDDQFCLEWSKRIISAKIRNSIALLSSIREIHVFSDDELHGLIHSLNHLGEADSVDIALGFEGNAARCYFSCLPRLIENEGFIFNGRSSRPPKDPFNSMISYGYSLFYRNIVGAIERHGLHPYFAFMHRLRFGHAALASDLIEEYRAPLIDKTVIDLINDRKVNASGFYVNEAGATYMDRDTSKRLTNTFSNIIAQGKQYFLTYGDDKSYGFQVMLDKKIGSILHAIEEHDATLYEPYIWLTD